MCCRSIVPLSSNRAVKGTGGEIGEDGGKLLMGDHVAAARASGRTTSVSNLDTVGPVIVRPSSRGCSEGGASLSTTTFWRGLCAGRLGSNVAQPRAARQA